MCGQIKSDFKGSEEHRFHEASFTALEQAFKLAEEAKGGLADSFIKELCATMARLGILACPSSRVVFDFGLV